MPAFVVAGHLVELEIVDGKKRIGIVVGTLHVGVALGEHELGFGRPVAYIVVGAEAANFAEALLRKVDGQGLPGGADETVAEKETFVLVGVREEGGARVYAGCAVQMIPLFD